MSQTVYILYNEQTEYVADRICKQHFFIEKVYSENFELTADIIKTMAEQCLRAHFYVIKTDKELLFNDFDFMFKPDSTEYVYIWGDTSLRLFNTDSVNSNPAAFTDDALQQGNVKLKNILNEVKIKYPVFDIVFLSYDESYADINYNKLKDRFPRAKRIHNVKGIYEAHKAAAGLAKSDMFYVVDADAEIVPTFDFSHQPHSSARLSVHVWHSHNPVNDLEYGYGGIKLFPKELLLAYNGSPVDFTTSVSKSFKVVPEVSNITRFNTDPFSAWRSGFRECVKLSSKLIHKTIQKPSIGSMFGVPLAKMPNSEILLSWVQPRVETLDLHIRINPICSG
jgi:hypothetical protein